MNLKVRQSLHTMFALSHRHGDILREGWKNILDCLLTLFKAKLLPECLVEVEDYLHPEGKISLLREETPSTRTDSSLLSSLYSYWLLSNDSGQGGGGGSKNLSPSEIKSRKAALKCVKLLSSLRVLLTLPPPTTSPMRDVRKQLANGISELVRSHSNTIKTPHDWSTLFTVIEYAGTSLPRYTAPGNVAMETVGMATQKQEVGVATDGEAVEAFEMDQSLGRSGRHGKLSPTRMNVPPPSIDREGNVTYTTASLQLLDLMDALYSRVVRIFDEKTVARLQSGSIGQPSETKGDIEISVPQLYCPEAGQDKSTRTSCSLLWHLAWCPLLQGMARMCCDPRRSVRQTSITYLQRALLAHELQSLLGNEWEACFLEELPVT